MNLLLARDQKSAALFSIIPLRIGSGVIFHLQAELELEGDEEELIKKYRFAKAHLVSSDPIDDIKMAFRPALLLGFLAFVILWFLLSFRTALPLSILVTLAMTAVYFKTLREQILVGDLLHGGRTFRWDSIVELIHKEAYLESICERLRQVLESAKHWGEREIIPIKPLPKQEAKRAVLGRV